jgi:nitrate reductase gamma subunit
MIAYKPIGMVFSILGGVLANLVFGQVWKRISDAPTPPNATDEDYTTREVLLAALLQGALFGLVKSAVDRAGMRAVRRFVWKPR